MKLRKGSHERLSPLKAVLESTDKEANPKVKRYMDLFKPLPKNWSPGTLHLEWKTCGRASCRCTQGLLHGPYIYLHRRDGPNQRKAYVAMRDLAQIIEELEVCQASVPRPSLMRRALKEKTP